MPYRFLDEAPTADVGLVASGATLDECFQSAADATLEVMLANAAALGCGEQRAVHVEGDSLDLALLGFLEELVYFKDAESLFLRADAVKVRQQNRHWCVDATLLGERIDPTRHHLAGDVKAVTMHQLRVEQTGLGWEATVVLDV